MKDEFNSWWHNGEALNNNPYELDSAAYWAWEGWCAAVKVEREACAKVCEECGAIVDGLTPKDCAAAIRARGRT